jgi:serine/arginine repetitive matrix protein 2
LQKQKLQYFRVTETKSLSLSAAAAMYNGIGLTTPRGSGTNGHIQRNISHLRSRPVRSNFNADNHGHATFREPNAEILAHDKKRQIELKCVQLKDILTKKGELSSEEVDKQVRSLREELMASLDKQVAKAGREYVVE